MRPKEYLMQIQRAKRTLREIESEIMEINERMAFVSHAFGSKIPSGNPETRSPQEKLTTTLIEWKERLGEEALKEQEKTRFIIARIRALPCKAHSDILYDRYVRGHKLERIALDMNYSYEYVRHLHGLALAEFGRRYPESSTQ